MPTVTTEFWAPSFEEYIDGLDYLLEVAPGLRWKMAEGVGPFGHPLITFTVPASEVENFADAYGLELEEFTD